METKPGDVIVAETAALQLEGNVRFHAKAAYGRAPRGLYVRLRVAERTVKIEEPMLSHAVNLSRCK